MKLSEIIKKYRKDNKLSLRAFAEKTNCSFQYISNLENEEVKNPSIPTLKSVAEAMNITLDELFKLADDFNIDISNTDSLTPITIKFDDYFPLNFYSGLSAGSFEELLDAEPDSVVYVPIKFQSMKDKLYAFKINGTSMNNVIVDGDIVVVEYNIDNHYTYKDGDIVVAFYGNEATCKRLYVKEESIFLMPDSDDKSHTPIIINRDEQFYIIGTVIWHMNSDDISRYY